MINEDLQEKLKAVIQETVMDEGKSEEDLNFFHDSNANQKKKKKKKKNDGKKKEKYIIKTIQTTRIKTRNFLTNIFCNVVTEEDFFNKNIVFDIYFLLTKNLNPFSIERKFQDETSREMLHMLWNEYPKRFL